MFNNLQAKIQENSLSNFKELNHYDIMNEDDDEFFLHLSEAMGDLIDPSYREDVETILGEDDEYLNENTEGINMDLFNDDYFLLEDLEDNLFLEDELDDMEDDEDDAMIETGCDQPTAQDIENMKNESLFMDDFTSLDEDMDLFEEDATVDDLFLDEDLDLLGGFEVEESLLESLLFEDPYDADLYLNENVFFNYATGQLEELNESHDSLLENVELEASLGVNPYPYIMTNEEFEMYNLLEGKDEDYGIDFDNSTGFESEMDSLPGLNTLNDLEELSEDVNILDGFDVFDI